MKTKKILFLYTEIAGYFLACCRALLHEGAEVHIIRYPLNREAPFQFEFPSGLNIYERNDYPDHKLTAFVRTIDPDIIVCSGWTDKDYLRICRQYKGRIPTVLTLDNQWNGGIKQRIAALAGPVYLKRRFSHCWVPGDPQFEYALRLGFKEGAVLTGFYSCDFDLFHQQYLANLPAKEHDFPKRFIYVGRYVEQKGIAGLWQAFIELQQESPNEWELWCLGTGDIVPAQHPKIRHFGFVQPGDMKDYIRNTGVFVLPSHFEPWGVVVHEFAAAGFPLVCSGRVGACTAFVENNINGYIYDVEQAGALKSVMKQIMDAPRERLLRMAESSVRKAAQNTPVIWAKKLTALIQ